MTKPKSRDAFDLSREELPDPRSRPVFNTGAVAQILEIPIWRLQKFLDSPRFELSVSDQLGSGRGSRRLFSREDVYRIGIANRLVADGFGAKKVAEAVKDFDDSDLLKWDEQGRQIRLGFVAMCRTRGSGRKTEYFPAARPPDLTLGGFIYYVLDVGNLIEGINERIQVVCGARTEPKDGARRKDRG
jgi:hypothetical protein